MLSVGIKGESSYTVGIEDTSKEMHTGDLEVLSSSCMIRLMETTACNSIKSYLEKGTDTVSTSMSFKHLSYTPAGISVRCESELIKIEGKKITFIITVHDDFGIIGTCVHERSIVDKQYFTMKAMMKKASKLQD